MCDNGTWRGNIPHCTPHSCTTYPCNQEQFCVLERGRPTCYQGSLGSWDGVLSVCYYQYHYWGYFNPHKYAITICLALAEVHPCTAFLSSLSIQQRQDTAEPRSPSEIQLVYQSTRYFLVFNDLFATGCHDVLSLDNGTVEHTKNRAYFHCDQHFYLEGNFFVVCVNGSWSGIIIFFPSRELFQAVKVLM